MKPKVKKLESVTTPEHTDNPEGWEMGYDVGKEDQLAADHLVVNAAQAEIDALKTQLADLKQELTNFDINYTGAESGDLHVYNEQWEVFKEKWLK